MSVIEREKLLEKSTEIVCRFEIAFHHGNYREMKPEFDKIEMTND